MSLAAGRGWSVSSAGTWSHGPPPPPPPQCRRGTILCKQQRGAWNLALGEEAEEMQGSEPSEGICQEKTEVIFHVSG